MNKNYVLIILILLTLTSCFIADGIFSEDNSNKVSLDKKVEQEISKYIKDNSENYIYKNYGFSELIIKKPAELVVLDDLKRKQKKDTSNLKIDSQIKRLKKLIKDKNIRYTLEMDHEYSLKNKETTQVELFETKFILADSIVVTEIIPLLNIKLTQKDVTIFENYFYETPIFSSGSYENNKKLSIQFYNYLKAHQDQLKGIKVKSDFLKHSLLLCQEIKEDGSFDHYFFLSKLTDQFFRKDSTIIDYKSIEHTNLFETKIDKKLVNYYLFHKFRHYINNRLDTSAVYIEFSPYYELNIVSNLEKPYNSYFHD